MEIKCPKCNEPFNVEAHAYVPKDQTMYMKLTCKSELFAARTIGESIVNMEALQRGVAKNLGYKVAVFLKSVELKPNEITIGFQIINAGFTTRSAIQKGRNFCSRRTIQRFSTNWKKSRCFFPKSRVANPRAFMEREKSRDFAASR